MIQNRVSDEGFYRRFMVSLQRLSGKEVCSNLAIKLFPVEITGRQPSDSHPQQEHCPDYFWFRRPDHNIQMWVDAWPEIAI